MSSMRVCDICGEMIQRVYDGRFFKVKECKYAGFGSFYWQTLDVHDKCVETLLEAKKKRKEEEQPDR